MSCKDSSNVLVNLQLHSGIAEIAAGKARMFVNKPDGSMYFIATNNYLHTDISCKLWTID